MTDLNQSALRMHTGVNLEGTEIDTLVVGAGQAGVAISEHLSKLGVPIHIAKQPNCWPCSAASATLAPSPPVPWSAAPAA